MTKNPKHARPPPAVPGWAAAALAVSSSLGLPACGGESDSDQPTGSDVGSDAGQDASLWDTGGGGICAEPTDASDVPDATALPDVGGGGICPVELDAGSLEDASETEDVGTGGIYMA